MTYRIPTTAELTAYAELAAGVGSEFYGRASKTRRTEMERSARKIAKTLAPMLAEAARVAESLDLSASLDASAMPGDRVIHVATTREDQRAIVCVLRANGVRATSGGTIYHLGGGRTEYLVSVPA